MRERKIKVALPHARQMGTLAIVAREEIVRCLRIFSGHKHTMQHAAQRLGVDTSTLQRYRKQLGITVSEYRQPMALHPINLKAA